MYNQIVNILAEVDINIFTVRSLEILLNHSGDP